MMTPEDIVKQSLAEFTSMQLQRSNFAMQWEEVAGLVWPAQTNTFYPGSFSLQGQKKTEKQVDATASLALTRFAAILDSLLTPKNMMWHYLTNEAEYLKKDRDTRLWFEIATRALFRYRYMPVSNFHSQNLNVYMMLGAFGTAFMYVDELYSLDGTTGMRYSTRPLGEIFLRENFQGRIDGFIRSFTLNPVQAIQQFGKEVLPEKIRECKDPNAQFDFIHRVCPRTDYDPDRRDAKNKPYASYYISMLENKLIREGGYRVFPGAACRYDQGPMEVYGRGPAMSVLPAIKTLNAEKRDYLTQGHRAVAPVLLTTDDGVVDFSMRPGALNKGGMSPDGKPLIGALPHGEIQVSHDMMEVERAVINDAFLVTLFQVLTESPQMTATEVIERTNEKGILLAPTIGRQESEYLGPLIEREIDIMTELRLLPPMPPLLLEARGEYNVVYTSPLSRAMRAQEVAGFGRTLQITMDVVNATQDPSPLDTWNFDRALPDISDIQAVPESWKNSNDEKAAIRQNRAEAMKQQQQIQAAPAAAALAKAAAVQKQAGMKPIGR